MEGGRDGGKRVCSEAKMHNLLNLDLSPSSFRQSFFFFLPPPNGLFSLVMMPLLTPTVLFFFFILQIFCCMYIYIRRFCKYLPVATFGYLFIGEFAIFRVLAP